MEDEMWANESKRSSVSLRALIAGDPTEARERVGDRLRTAGFKISYADDGLEAFNAFLQRPAKLIVTDREMPRLNGLGLVRRIRALSDVPVLMVTASGSIPDCEEAMRIGVDRYLQFGRDLDRVGHIARELIQRRSAPSPTLAIDVGGFDRDESKWTAKEARLLGRREFREELQRHLFECRGNMAEMARRMGKDRSTIRYHLRRLEMLEPKAVERDHVFARRGRDRWGTNVPADPR